MSYQGNNANSVTNPAADQVIVASGALFAGQYDIQFTASSDNGAGDVAFQLLRNANNVVLTRFKEKVGGLTKWGFTGTTKENDVFQVVSKTADARTIHGSVTWLFRG